MGGTGGPASPAGLLALGGMDSRWEGGRPPGRQGKESRERTGGRKGKHRGHFFLKRPGEELVQSPTHPPKQVGGGSFRPLGPFWSPEDTKQPPEGDIHWVRYCAHSICVKNVCKKQVCKNAGLHQYLFQIPGVPEFQTGLGQSETFDIISIENKNKLLRNYMHTSHAHIC